MKSNNIYYNPNPAKKENRDDCVVRAICKATGKDWDTERRYGYSTGNGCG